MNFCLEKFFIHSFGLFCLHHHSSSFHPLKRTGLQFENNCSVMEQHLLERLKNLGQAVVICGATTILPKVVDIIFSSFFCKKFFLLTEWIVDNLVLHKFLTKMFYICDTTLYNFYNQDILQLKLKLFTMIYQNRSIPQQWKFS